MVSAPWTKTMSPAQAVVAVVLQVRERRLQVLLWKRALDPLRRAPGPSRPGSSSPGETLDQSIRRHLAAKVDVRELAHLEQLETRSDPDRNPLRWELATAFLGLVPADVDPALPGDTSWHPVDAPPRARLRPRADRPRRARPAARQALLHEHRLRARPGLVHDLGAARPLPRRARPRCLGHEPPARPAAAPPARADRDAPRPGPDRRAARAPSSASGPARSRSPTSSRCCARPQRGDCLPGADAL